MENTPQKRIAIASLLLVVFVLVLYMYPSTLSVRNASTNQKGKADSSTLLASQILTISTIENPNDDPDKDGIPNWQENILGTDPHIKNEVNTESLQISSEDKKRLDDTQNMTVALAKNNLAVASYVQTLGSSTDINYEGISNDVLQTTAASFSFKEYKTGDVVNKVKATQIARKAYGNTIGFKTADVIHNYITVDEKVALKDIMDDKKNTDNIQALAKKVKGVATFRDFLLTMPVPDDAITYHLGYVNAVERYLETLDGFQNVKEDPLKTALFLRGYKDVVQSQFKFLSDFETYFSKNNLVFSSKEAGYMFTVGINK